jgi:hypothetical protein
VAEKKTVSTSHLADWLRERCRDDGGGRQERPPADEATSRIGCTVM